MPAILTPDLGLLFWMLLAFLVVFIVLGYFAFPVITKMVESRKKLYRKLFQMRWKIISPHAP